MTSQLLTLQNYRLGFLVDDEAIGGVTEMVAEGGAQVYSAYVSHYLTGETYAYQEFDRPEDALAFLGTIDRAWAYEAVGCGTSKQKTAGLCQSSGASGSSGGCGSGSCGPSGCA